MEVGGLSSNKIDAIEHLREKVKLEIRTDYDFALFCILPGLNEKISEIKKMAKKIGISEPAADRYAELLIGSGYWKVDTSLNHVSSNFELLDLGDLSIKDYLAMTVCIVSRLSESKSYEYDSLSIVTSRSLVKGFVREVNQALKKLYVKSSSGDYQKDCVFSWTHTGVIEIESKNKSLKGREEEWEE